MKKNIFSLLFFIFAINGFSQSINVSEMYKTIDYSDKKFDFLVEKGFVLSPPYGENGKYIFTHPQTKESLLIQYNLAYEKDAGDFATAIYKFSNRDYFDKFIQSLPENIFEYNPQNKIYIRQNRDPAYEKISIVKQAPTQESLFYEIKYQIGRNFTPPIAYGNSEPPKKADDERIFSNDSTTVEDIKNIQSIPYIENCNDSIFWNLVKQGKKNIPDLIDKLTDETVLKEVFVPMFGGEYTVADASLVILQEKIKGIPVFDLIGKKISKDCGYCAYWYFVREKKKNRILLQKNLRKWYSENEKNLIWVESPHSLTGDCFSPANGHYEIKKHK